MSTHYIVIDNVSGFIFGETFCDNVFNACRNIDRDINEYGRWYDDVDGLASNETGYLVYEYRNTDRRIVENGQDQKTIDEVIQNGKLIATIKVHYYSEFA